MTKFAVDIAQVSHAAAMITSSSQAVSGEVQTMMAHLDNLQTTWQGSASAQFQQAASQWRATQAQVEAALIEINRALTHSAQVYQEAEQQVHTNFAF